MLMRLQDVSEWYVRVPAVRYTSSAAMSGTVAGAGGVRSTTSAALLSTVIRSDAPLETADEARQWRSGSGRKHSISKGS